MKFVRLLATLSAALAIATAPALAVEITTATAGRDFLEHVAERGLLEIARTRAGAFRDAGAGSLARSAGAGFATAVTTVRSLAPVARRAGAGRIATSGVATGVAVVASIV